MPKRTDNILSAEGCTAFSATGEASGIGKTINMKVRDLDTYNRQMIRAVTPSEGFKHIGIFDAEGPSGCKGGMNEKGVSVSTVALFSNEHSESGLNGGQILSAVLEKADNAKAGVYIIAGIIKEKSRADMTGKAGAGGSGAVIGDPGEIWISQQTCYHSAEKGPIKDDIFAMANHYIFPELAQYESRPDLGKKRRERALSLLESAKGDITVPIMMRFSRDQQSPSDRAYMSDGERAGNICNEGYGRRTISAHIHVSACEYTDVMSVSWYTIESPLASPYIPFYMGLTQIPEKFETTEAAEVFASLQLLLNENPEYKKSAVKIWENLEFSEIYEQGKFEKRIVSLLKEEKKEEAIALLNNFSRSNCDKALELANDLIKKITKETEWRVADI